MTKEEFKKIGWYLGVYYKIDNEEDNFLYLISVDLQKGLFGFVFSKNKDNWKNKDIKWLECYFVNLERFSQYSIKGKRIINYEINNLK